MCLFVLIKFLSFDVVIFDVKLYGIVKLKNYIDLVV